MTKQELLTDLQNKPFIGSVGTPEAHEVKPDGTKPYQVNVREEGHNTAIYRNIFFYVVDEGAETEKAFYKDSEIKRTLPFNEFKDFVKANIGTTNPEILSYKFVSIDEEDKEGVIKATITDIVNEGQFTVKSFVVVEKQSKLVVLPLSLSADLVAGTNQI